MLGVFLIRSEAAGVRNASHVIWVTTCLTVYSKKNRRSHVNDCLWLYPGFAVWTGEDGGGAQTLVSPDHPERTGQPWMIAPHWEKSAALQSPWPPSPVRSSFWYRPVLPDHHTVLKGNQDSRSDLHWPTAVSLKILGIGPTSILSSVMTFCYFAFWNVITELKMEVVLFHYLLICHKLR